MRGIVFEFVGAQRARRHRARQRLRGADRLGFDRFGAVSDVIAVADAAALETGGAERAAGIDIGAAGRGGNAVDQVAVGIEHHVGGIEVRHPVRRIGPVAVTGLGAHVVVGVVLRDPVPIEIERLVKRGGAVAVRRLAVEEAGVAARQHADDDLHVVGLVEDQRTAGIAAGGDTFVGESVIAPGVEVVRAGLHRAARRIVEIDPIEVLLETVGLPEEERLERVERGERAQHVLGRTAAEVDPTGRTGGSGAVVAVAGDGDVITGAVGTLVLCR